jgi:hypothetical protein
MQTNRAVPPEGKVVYYRSDGSGRDTYIRDHNGGLLTKDKIHKLTQFKAPVERNFSFSTKKYNKHPYEYNTGGSNKFVHYVSDGSGRDFYVASTEGGNSNPFRWRNETELYFRNTLRNNQKLPNVLPFPFRATRKRRTCIWLPSLSLSAPTRSFTGPCLPFKRISQVDCPTIRRHPLLLPWKLTSSRDSTLLGSSGRRTTASIIDFRPLLSLIEWLSC